MRERARAEKQPPRYNRRCRRRMDEPDLPYVLRFAAPEEGKTVIRDLLRGDVRFENAQLDDMIIVSSVSYPKSGNRMNHLQTHVVGDLVDAQEALPSAQGGF